MKKPISTKPYESALLIIDMLNDFVLKDAPLEIPRAKEIVSVIKDHIETARYLNWLIVYVCDSHDKHDKEFEKWPEHAVIATYGSDIVGALKPKVGDLVVPKTRYSGFFKTRLETYLRARKIEKLHLVGVATNICVLATATDALMRDFEVVVYDRATAALTSEQHLKALAVMKGMGVEIN